MECGSANGGDYKTTNTVKQHIREHFPYRRSLAAEQLLQEIKKGKLFGYVQCDIEVPEKLSSKFNNSNIQEHLSKSDIGDLMKNYAEEERLLSQPRKRLISSFTLQNGTLFTPLLLFYLQLGLVVTKTPFCRVHSKEMFHTALYRQQWTQEGKVTKIPIQVSSQKQRSF